MSAEGQLKGRVALVTGASRGIGAAIAKRLASEGAHVVLLARSRHALEDVDDAITASGGEATLMPFDLRKTDELEGLGPALYQRFGRLDFFVPCAGILGEMTPVSHAKMSDWQAVFSTNVLANVQLIRTLEPLLKASDQGRAVLVASPMGQTPRAFHGQYGASQAALLYLYRTWADEVRQTGLRVNVVAPSHVDTDMLVERYPGGYAGRDLLSPDQVAQSVLELLSSGCTRHGDVVALAA